MKRIISAGQLNWAKKVGAVFVLCATTAMALPAQTFTTLHSFDGTDGTQPIAALIQGTDGNLYGTTQEGGTYGGGTVFKITPSGTLTTLHNFCADDGCTDGQYPFAGLVEGTDGNFYGTTGNGGPARYGTIFKMTPGGTVTTLFTFVFTDGGIPLGGLVQATNGDFYGTTDTGGANNAGTIFRITPSGALTTLYNFCSQRVGASNCLDGAVTYAGLVQAADGDLYGVTAYGGANVSDYQGGTIFKITPSGTLTTLYSFCAQMVNEECTDGSEPFAALVQATNGSFYGTTQKGGASGADGGGQYGGGTSFQFTPGGTLTTLYNFCSLPACADGADPAAGLVQATNGDFYGATASGGNCEPNTCGTLFEITPSGALTTLYRFCPQIVCTDGSFPLEGLVQDTNGDFYGTTDFGGANCAPNGCGTVFRLSVGLGPFVKTLPTTGKVGAAVKILGTNLAGASGVTFNGTPAVFGVFSGSETEITAAVPVGATTGMVQVVTPSGTLSSNVPFEVIP